MSNTTLNLVEDQQLKTALAIQQKNQTVEILKELFDKGKIYLITDVSKDEAKLMTRIYMVAQMKHLDRWLEGLAYYVTILV